MISVSNVRCAVRQLVKNALFALVVTSSSMASDGIVGALGIEAVFASEIDNVITVAKGGAEFSDLKSAMASITDASELNPYLVQIGPGVYELSSIGLVVKSHVSLVGAGQGVTTIIGTNASTSIDPVPEHFSTIVVTTGSKVSNLSVINMGKGVFGRADGVFVSGIGATLENLEIGVVSDETSVMRGITVSEGAEDVRVSQSIVSISSAGNFSESVGILNFGDRSHFSNLRIFASTGGEGEAIGILNINVISTGDYIPSASIELSEIEVGNGLWVKAVVFQGVDGRIVNTRLVATSSVSGITGSGFAASFGVLSYDSELEIFNSVIKSNGASIDHKSRFTHLVSTDSVTKVSNTQLIGLMFGNNIFCFNTFDDSLAAVTCP